MAAKFLSKPCRQHREFQKAPVSLSRGDTVLMPSMQESPLRCSERLLRTVCKILARRISHPALEDKSAASKSRHHRLSPCEAKHFTCPELGGSKNKNLLKISFEPRATTSKQAFGKGFGCGTNPASASLRAIRTQRLDT
ncbi:unnamed protein product [Symbiodinium necroappetens]|uniref:Uncharacterized protein n=1 Tax=Symbiodinium necroappetens TaxID=1628268 RepID=A0A813AYI3_9DINO|nr:unnamed protein product [Symbiodinium necroappetens]